MADNAFGVGCDVMGVCGDANGFHAQARGKIEGDGNPVLRYACGMRPLALLLLTCALAMAAPPVAEPDSFSTNEDTALARTAAGGLLANDTPGTALSPACGVVAAPLHGVLVLQPDGSFSFAPALNYSGTDSFTYKIYGDRPSTTFTIDEAASTLKVSATLRITFQGIPSISSDSSTSHVKGTVVAGVAPDAAPFSIVQVTDLDSILTDAVSLKLGVGCIPILNTCLGAVQFDSAANAISLSMENPSDTAAVRSNGGFDTAGATFSVAGDGTIKGTEQLEPYFPPTALPLNLPAIPMPFNGRLTSSGGQARLEMQINFSSKIALDATTSLTFGLSGVIKATAPLPLPAVEESPAATVSLTIDPVNDAPLGAPDSYLVRSGTSLSVSATGAQTTQNLITAGSTWKYKHDGTDLGTAWRAWAYNDTAWASGPAELGYGDVVTFVENRPEATNIKGSAARWTAYFRKEFTVTDVNATRSLSLDLLRDDGAAVYLNGIEVARQNLAPAASYTTPATSRIPNADETRFFPESLPPALLLEGKNVIAVEVHQFSLTNLISLAQIDYADLSFDLKLRRDSGLTGVLANDTDVDNPAAALTVSLHTPPEHGTVELDPNGAFRYTPAPGFVGTDHFVYQLADGGTQDAELRLVAAGASWKYLDNGSDQGTAWRAPAFADGSWSTGTAEIGYGDDNTLDDRPEATKLSYFLTTPPTTTYFRKKFTLPVPRAMLKSLKLRLLRDDGAAVYLNGVEIARDNLPAAAGFEDGATLPVEGEAEGQFVEFTVPATGLAALVEGENVLAVELHQNLFVSNDASFDCELIAAATPGGRVTLNVAADDFDGDLVSDAWERQHGFDFSVPDGTADPDGDGRSNRMEFLAATDPRDRASHLRIDSIAKSGDRLSLHFPTSAQRRYVIQESPDLVYWHDSAIPALQGTGEIIEALVTPDTATQLFYRAAVDYQFP